MFHKWTNWCKEVYFYCIVNWWQCWKSNLFFLTPTCLWCYLVGNNNSCATKYSASCVHLKFETIIFSSRNQKLGDLNVHVGGGKGKGSDHLCMLAAEVGLFSASLFCDLIGTVTVGCNTQYVMEQKSLESSTALLLNISWSSSSVQAWGWSVAFLKFWGTLQWQKHPACLSHFNYNRNPLSCSDFL